MESLGLKGPVGAAGAASAAESVEGAGRDRSVADRFEDALRKREAAKRKPDPQPSGVPTWLPWLVAYEPNLSLDADARRAALAADVAGRAHLAGLHDAGEAAPPLERAERTERIDAPGDAADRSRTKPSPDDAAASRKDGGADVSDARESRRLQTVAAQDGGASGRHHATVGAAVPVGAIAGHADGPVSMSGRGGRDIGERRKGESGPAGVAALGAFPAPVLPWQGLPPRAPAPLRSPFVRTGSNVRHEMSPRTGAARGTGMRYAFQQWGDGHFVQIRAAEIDGQPGFVLGASDATVQRRLSAMWSGASSDPSSRVAAGGIAVHAIEPVGADPQSEGEGGEGGECGEGGEDSPC
ncbi:hypothetical protein PMO31116_01444 [Pandoraea morbifera]|uniref:Surface presentation of antigen domain-containing protein n=1 Tax=Pandoraea morbifera TaxID=2508300 RepID=A0A5E4TJ01_9BURK|nr:hypothetical protein [Pandoraea morbifera]VVD87986.1 hypothetical protein PMO31116_01444 [Pandoraea morbifera]